jgi:hypothetical protein
MFNPYGYEENDAETERKKKLAATIPAVGEGATPIPTATLTPPPATPTPAAPSAPPQPSAPTPFVPAAVPGGPTIAPGTGILRPPDWTEPDNPSFDPYTPTPPAYTPGNGIVTESAPTPAAPAPAPAPAPPVTSSPIVPVGTLAPVPLDPATVQQYRTTMAGVSPPGSDPVSEEFIRADIARTEAAQKAASQPGFRNYTPEQRDAMPLEQQIALGLTVPGDPNNKGFGGTPGVDPTGGAPARTLQGGVEQYADGTPVPGGYNAADDAARQLAAAGAAPVTPAPIVRDLTPTDTTPSIPRVGSTLAPPGLATGIPVTRPPSGVDIGADPFGGATDIHGSIPTNVPTITPPTVTPGGNSGAAPTTRDNGQTAIGTFGPGADLRSSSVLPADTVDRFKLAQDRLNSFRTARQPQHDANVRRIIEQNGAALGRLGSGMLNTDVGNESLAFERENRDEESRVLQDALEGTIGDARSNRGEYRTERDYQSGTARQAVQDAITQWLMEQQAQQQDFNQGTTLAGLGYGNSPANLFFGQGQQYGQQAGQAWDSLAQLLSQWYAGRPAKAA